MRGRLLDIACKAGGAAMGYHRAGWEVVGVDIEPQPNYPFEFHQADALDFPLDGFDAFHASPPCKRYTAGAKRWGTTEQHPDLIAAVRERLIETGAPYVIENVEGAADDLINPMMLCGTMFGLGVIRHRLFETSFLIEQPPHYLHHRRVGDGYETVTGHAGGSSKRDGWKSGGVASWRAAMGIDWMTGEELAQAIPPAYAEYVGRRIPVGAVLL